MTGGRADARRNPMTTSCGRGGGRRPGRLLRQAAIDEVDRRAIFTVRFGRSPARCDHRTPERRDCAGRPNSPAGIALSSLLMRSSSVRPRSPTADWRPQPVARPRRRPGGPTRSRPHRRSPAPSPPIAGPRFSRHGEQKPQPRRILARTEAIFRGTPTSVSSANGKQRGSHCPDIARGDWSWRWWR